MPNFLLVHGAWHGGWCWDRVVERLAGHQVFAPTLKGLGERADELTDETNLSDHVDELVELIETNALNDIVLCGHSYGGAVVTQLADQLPDRIAAIVYLDAYMPPDGESVLSLTPSWPDTGEATLPIPPPEHFGLTGDDAQLVGERLTLHPAAASRQRLSLQTDTPAGLIRHRTCVLATGYGGNHHIDTTYASLVDDPDWHTESVDGSHDLMIDRPDDVARILLQAAERAGL